MAVEKLSLKKISRRGTNISEDSLEFAAGVNVLVGEANTGKTKWLESIDYVLGDDVSAEKRDDDDIFKRKAVRD
jgi:predicted ATP-dependent endonuclease of OLD family